jgi:hypothetical protein
MHGRRVWCGDSRKGFKHGIRKNGRRPRYFGCRWEPLPSFIQLLTATQREERLNEKEGEAATVTVLAEEGSGGREEVPKTPNLKVCLHYCSWVSIRSN